MAQIISYKDLARQHHLNFLEHQRREHREREEYLAGLRKLLFQVEAQMRQAEIQQLEVFRQIAAHFKVPLKFPSLGDRVAWQEFFSTNPFLETLMRFFTNRLTVDDCYSRLTATENPTPTPESGASE
ncbi:MAG: hypothetical protein FJ126_12155 [Deltaproteobacteria bacterium]|nr:hypothetical protein [Deltaproteobacteria bacterium]